MNECVIDRIGYRFHGGCQGIHLRCIRLGESKKETLCGLRIFSGDRPVALVSDEPNLATGVCHQCQREFRKLAEDGKAIKLSRPKVKKKKLKTSTPRYDPYGGGYWDRPGVPGGPFHPMESD